MALEGTPTKCTFDKCPAPIALAHLTTGHIITSYEFSCKVHGFLGWFEPSHVATPVSDAVFTFAELSDLLKLARAGQRGICDAPVVEKLARRLTAAATPDYPVTERPTSGKPGTDLKTT